MTPLMQQFWNIKSQHPDKIVLFRMGDFFEMFHQDAEVAAPILGIQLTVRNRKAGDETKMCGVPHHSVAGPIAKLLEAGHKVAICDQIEDPALAKGLVKRAVTRVLSPGMVYDPETLDPISANYLSAFDDHWVAFLDSTTGDRFHYSVRSTDDRYRIWSLLRPTEIVLTDQQRAKWQAPSDTFVAHLTVFTGSPGASSEVESAVDRLVSYAQSMQGESLLKILGDSEERRQMQYLELSETCLRHLEVFVTSGGEKRGSLFSVLNAAKTSAGSRRLKQWLSQPLLSVDQITHRHDQVAYWLAHAEYLRDARSALAEVGDIERRVGRLALPTCNARDLVALVQSLKAGIRVSPLVPEGGLDMSLLTFAEDLISEIDSRVVDDPPVGSKVVGAFRHGFSTELDELIELTDHAQALILALEEREKAATGISSLKIRFNQVFGYYFEVTRSNLERVPSHFKRKQTLANAERFITPELEELEGKILSAQARRLNLEGQLLLELRDRILDGARELRALAAVWAELDAVLALAWIALERRYVRPLLNESGIMRFESLRHPVVEMKVGGDFVPNSLEMRGGDCLLLTGPNMAGKSTLMRQVALAAILAQMGSFVPALSAELPIFERVFTRIGASDSLHEGLSTFMVEMKETSEILLRSNKRSLVILDEIGRGTSTFDGMSLAQAILEHLVQNNRPILLFATHYHELTPMAEVNSSIRNAQMSIRDHAGSVQFLYTLADGPASKSYGIHVARLAGLPKSVTLRAEELLRNHEEGAVLGGITGIQLELGSNLSPEVSALVSKIREFNVQRITPLEALNQIAQWQQSLS